MSTTTPRRRRTTEEQQALRESIARAVRALRGSGGDEAVTIRAVAAEVGVAPMSLYRYFPDKQSLVAAAWEVSLRAACQAALDAAARARTPGTRLRALYRGYTDYWLANGDAYRMVFGRMSSGEGLPGSVAGPAAEFRAEAERLIDACLPDGLAAESRAEQYDLCRCKIVGFLQVANGLAHKGHTALERLRETLLEDIARQLATV